MRVLRVEKLVPGGYGLARTEEGTVLVRGALPGEVVRGRPTRRKGALFLEEAEVLTPRPDRYPHPLPPTADLPLLYESQLPLKAGLVQDALERIAKLPFPLSPIRPSPRALAYRTAAQYARHPLGGLAYRLPNSHGLVRVEEDPLVAEPLAQALRVLSLWPLPVEEVALRGSLLEGKVLLGLIGGSPEALKRPARALVREGFAGVVWAEPSERGRFRGRVQLLQGEGTLRERFGPLTASVSVEGFSQANPLAAGELLEEAQGLVAGGGRALELYAGSGLLSLLLAPRFREVVAVEIGKEAVRRGEADRRRLGVENVRFHRGDAREAARLGAFDLVVLDPPRAGLSPGVRRYLLETRPREVLYIACNPATWARDVGELVRGGYALAFARPYDFFPFTHHVEVLSLLRLG
ncbi:class I SAM-dependent RNA methyltransferase [Thermus thermamylovorans]|uniref:Class I SAM-dependent RNA methyltransferase n=1 Tax=Thermus thermamylovorans TaxID=2509362 RepID=A0A4Q9B481_9DEIN|nr:methyltransferase domain-containing protein [Thermus thermamylovorans]TBH20602.1 class I SAM-dependent RNA methyltransferase [Thermus thermamylovorans]